MANRRRDEMKREAEQIKARPPIKTNQTQFHWQQPNLGMRATSTTLMGRRLKLSNPASIETRPATDSLADITKPLRGHTVDGLDKTHMGRLPLYFPP